MKKKKNMIRLFAFFLSFLLWIGILPISSLQAAEDEEKTVTIGVTDHPGTLNPLLMDWSFVNLYAASLMFLPLMSFTNSFEVDGLLAESVETEDNLRFHVTLREDAVWSDGEPVTTDDVIFTILSMTSPAIGNKNFSFSLFAGFDENGLSPDGARSIEGLVKIDDTHMDFVVKEPMYLSTFLNNVATWICILPSHVLKDIPTDQLPQNEWFLHPDVVSGPFKLVNADFSSQISYERNESYFMGTPKIQKLVLRIMPAADLLPGILDGEIDFVQPAIGAIPIEDRAAVEALDQVTAVYSPAITDEMVFINCRNISDSRIRKAILYAINRQAILDEVLGGKGEITDGFICSQSPYYADKVAIPYDPTMAEELLQEAGWDSSKTIRFYVGANNDTTIKAAVLVKDYLEAVGLTVELHAVSFENLMESAGTNEADMFAVEYTITPIDYYFDIRSLVDRPDSWVGGWMNSDVHRYLQKTQIAGEDWELVDLYRAIDEVMMEEVPMFSLYFFSNLGVVSDRLINARPLLFGAFSHIQDWDVRWK